MDSRFADRTTMLVRYLGVHLGRSLAGPSEQVIGRHVVGNINVGKKIFVEIGDDDSQTFAILGSKPEFLRHNREGTVPQTAIYLVGDSLEVTRPAIPGTVIVVMTDFVIGECHVEVIHNVKIQVEIAIQIKPRYA